jgi:ubiquinone/menaquinone biosynthesis C-methylase UbiE
MADPWADIDRHYGRGGLLERVLTALAEAGKDIERLSIDDLAPIDELHSRRRAATVELTRLLAPRSGDRVIDVGSGIGGPARYLARACGCRVDGIDATAEFVTVATELTRRVGLSDQVRFRHGSALALPFPDARFDIAWTQNVAMNIADRPRFYAELYRVLRPGGRLGLQDVVQGPGGAVIYPVVWADEPALSFLRTADETRTLLEAAGFTVREWHDNTEAAITEADAARHAAPPHPHLGVQLVVGERFGEKLRNGQRNLVENRARLINAVLTRP